MFARRAPTRMKKLVRWQNTRELPPGYPVERDSPRYNPWDQRLCVVADGDVFTAIREGSLEVVTDHIDHVDATGVALKSGRHLAADIIVKATGLNLLALGGVRISVDGTGSSRRSASPTRRTCWRTCPIIWCIGYTSASPGPARRA